MGRVAEGEVDQSDVSSSDMLLAIVGIQDCMVGEQFAWWI